MLYAQTKPSPDLRRLAFPNETPPTVTPSDGVYV
jgi:hypothetical protein